MTKESLSDGGTQNLHGLSDMLPADEEHMLEETTGYSADDCANVFVRTTRPDGQAIIDRADVCD